MNGRRAEKLHQRRGVSSSSVLIFVEKIVVNETVVGRIRRQAGRAQPLRNLGLPRHVIICVEISVTNSVNQQDFHRAPAGKLRADVYALSAYGFQRNSSGT